MLSKPGHSHRRPQFDELAKRLIEPRRFIQVVAGARQVGKTTLVGQVLEGLEQRHIYASADEPALRDVAWLSTQWDRARLLATEAGPLGAILALDEIQKVHDWSETVKRLWDEDTRSGTALRVLLLGSSPLLMKHGLTESLAGRFELVHLPHWSFDEMRTAFGFTLEEYLYFGGYPGAAPLRDDVPRWRRYMLDSLIETTISRDVLLMSRVDKPALLRRLFDLGCRYSGQVLSYSKMLGQLKDAGNTTTLAHYLELLGGAGMLTGLQKFSGAAVRRRASSPKLQVMNTALMTAQSGLSPEEALSAGQYRGRLVESAVGAHLVNAAVSGYCELHYWRQGSAEVDFVFHSEHSVVAIEVKSGRTEEHHAGLSAFGKQHSPTRSLIVGTGGIPLEEFLTTSPHHWLEASSG